MECTEWRTFSKGQWKRICQQLASDGWSNFAVYLDREMQISLTEVPRFNCTFDEAKRIDKAARILTAN
jgi:hypothetical protein